MRNVLKIIGGVVGMVIMLVIPILLLGGALVFFERFGENLARFCGWLFVATIVLLLFTPIRSLRGPIGSIIYVFTFAWGAFVWLYSAYVCWAIWGALGLLIGLFILGVGVAPVALLAFIFHGHFADAGWLLLSIGLVIGFRLLSIWLMAATKKDDEQYYAATGGSM